MHHNDSKENNMRIAKRIAEKNAAANETNTQNINTDNQELYEFEQEVDSMLATGSMDQALRVIDAEGVATPNRFPTCSRDSRKLADVPTCSSRLRTAWLCSTWSNIHRTKLTRPMKNRTRMRETSLRIRKNRPTTS